MPVILEQTEIQLQFSDTWNRIKHPYPKSHERTPGVHLSGILRHIALTSNILKRPRYKNTEFDQFEEDMPLCMAVGVALEEFLTGLYPEMIWQPGELCLDNIFGTPDGTTVLDHDPYLQVEEFKATWKSERNHPLLSEWLWMKQISGYLKMLDTTLARLHVLWVAGTYYPPSPKLMRYVLQFTQEEIDKDWAMIRRNRDSPGVLCEK